ncbi:MAG: DUF4956 domain-containing protein [Saprospiraceae bacterium]|nr:DUF4956 domain-containing protein [Saprospiraceae bacterium]
MPDFEKYFNLEIHLGSFVLNLLITAIIAYLIKLFYIKYGRAISDRRKFSNNFIPLAIGTLLIITVIKSSVALSLGLVGALSIVRFRSAIKDPEELTMLFLIIGFGLMGGADKPVLSLLSFALVLPIFYFNSLMSKNKGTVTNKAFLNVSTKNKNVTAITASIEPHTSYLEIKRVDSVQNGINASFYCTIDGPAQLQKIIEAVNNEDPEATVSFVEQPDLLL